MEHDAPTLAVTAHRTTMSPLPDGSIGTERPRIAVAVANPGNVPVLVTLVHFETSGPEPVLLGAPKAPYGTTALPTVIQPGASETWYFLEQDMSAGLRWGGFTGTIELKACADDVVGRHYTAAQSSELAV